MALPLAICRPACILAGNGRDGEKTPQSGGLDMDKKTLATVAITVAGMIGGAAEAPQKADDRPAVEPGKILIAYYSWSGNTRAAAQIIRKATGGALFEIKTVKDYPTDYELCVKQAKHECRHGVKPEIVARPDDFAKYEVVFVGSPNWWGTMAPPLLTFLSGCDFSNKTVVPFFTHGGGGAQNCGRDVRKVLAVYDCRILKGGFFYGSSVNSDAEEIITWVNDTIKIKK